jgi:hypothetical protein
MLNYGGGQEKRTMVANQGALPTGKQQSWLTKAKGAPSSSSKDQSPLPHPPPEPQASEVTQAAQDVVPQTSEVTQPSVVPPWRKDSGDGPWGVCDKRTLTDAEFTLKLVAVMDAYHAGALVVIETSQDGANADVATQMASSQSSQAWGWSLRNLRPSEDDESMAVSS